MYLQGHHLNVFGDRVDDPSIPLKTTEHDVTLERLPRSDPSAAKDRILYEIRGIDLGTNRKFLLMVSPKGPQRLIFLGRCGGIWATPLEPRSSFDGPVKATD